MNDAPPKTALPVPPWVGARMYTNVESNATSPDAGPAVAHGTGGPDVRLVASLLVEPLSEIAKFSFEGLVRPRSSSACVTVVTALAEAHFAA